VYQSKFTYLDRSILPEQAKGKGKRLDLMLHIDKPDIDYKKRLHYSNKKWIREKIYNFEKKACQKVDFFTK
jgi:hypothetical protein